METISTSTALADMQMKARIDQLEKQSKLISDINSNLTNINKSHSANIDNLIDTLISYVVSGEIDRDVAKDLAACVGRDLVRTINVNFSITGTMELSIPVDVELDDISDEFTVTILPSYESDVVLEWDDIHSFEIEES